MTGRFTLMVAAGLCLLPGLVSGQDYEDIRRLREAQRRQQQQQQNVPKENLEASGIIKGMRGAVIQVTTDAGDQWLVQVQPARPQDVSFSGSGDASFLKPGMLVQFTSRLSKRGQADEPISSLQVFTPREGYQVGVVASQGEGGGLNNLFDVKEEEAKPKAKVAADAVYRVAGQITKISRGGEMTINAGGTTVKATLTDDAKVSVEVADLSYARPGDKVEVRGWYPQGTKGQAIGTNVSVTAAQPLTSGKKKPIAKPAAEKAGDETKADTE